MSFRYKENFKGRCGMNPEEHKLFQILHLTTKQLHYIKLVTVLNYNNVCYIKY